MASQVARQIGANIRAARARKSLTQSDLARLIDSENFQVSRWERGQHRPSDESLHKLGMALGLGYAEFFTEPEEKAA